MRKQYIKPELEVFCFEAETLMSLSQPENEKVWIDEDGQDAAGSNKFEHGWSSSPWE